MRLKERSVHNQADLRERKRVATTRALEIAAIELFTENGFRRTSIDAIADRAGVSRSTFFRYFGSKEAVLFGPEDARGNAFAELIRQRPDHENPLEAFEGALLEMARAAEEGPEIRGLEQARQDLLNREPILRAKRAQNLSKWIEKLAVALAERDGEAEPSPAHRLASSVGVAITQEMGEEWLSGPEVDGETLVRNRFELLRELFSPSKPR